MKTNQLFHKPVTTMTYDQREELSSYLDSINVYGPLSCESEVFFARRALAGDKAARDELVSSCLKLVVSIASKFHTKRLPLSDLIQEGNEALLRAAMKYDPDEYVGGGVDLTQGDGEK